MLIGWGEIYANVMREREGKSDRFFLGEVDTREVNRDLSNMGKSLMRSRSVDEGFECPDDPSIEGEDGEDEEGQKMTFFFFPFDYQKDNSDQYEWVKKLCVGEGDHEPI